MHPYVIAFPARRDPVFYWTNQYMPGGLSAFWQHAQRIRELLDELGTDPTERQTRLEDLIRPLTGLPAGTFHGLPAVSQVRFLAAPRAGRQVLPARRPSRPPQRAPGLDSRAEADASARPQSTGTSLHLVCTS